MIPGCWTRYCRVILYITHTHTYNHDYMNMVDNIRISKTIDLMYLDKLAYR